LDFLLTYKLSQDHLELYFGCIRSRLGCNNNPTAKQFESTYKRLLIHGVFRGFNGNCLPQDDTEALCADQTSMQGRTESDLSEIENQYGLLHTEWDHDYVKSLIRINELSPFQEAVMEYVGGFVVRQALRKINCEICCQSIAKQVSMLTDFLQS